MKKYVAALLICVILGAGCAVKPTDPAELKIYEEQNDPMEPMNRGIFAFNSFLDKIIIKPVAQGYRFITPKFFRTGVDNFFNNIKQPVYIVNALLQADGEAAWMSTKRFVVNTMMGGLGVLDPATANGWTSGDNDFGQTLGVYGVPSGPYLVLPLLGPSNPRDTVGLAADTLISPVDWAFSDQFNWEVVIGKGVIDGISKRERGIEFLDNLEKTSTDPYATIRSMYQQNRKNKVERNKETDVDKATGEESKKDYEFDFDIDFDDEE